VLHAVISDLFGQPGLVFYNHLFDNDEPLFLVLEVLSDSIRIGVLVGDIVFHLVDALSDLTELVFDTRLKILDLLQVRCARVNFNLQFGGSRLSIIKLSLFEFEIFFHFSDISLSRKLVLLLDLLAHVLKEGGNDFSLSRDLLLVALLLLFKLNHEIVDLFFLLMENFILLCVAIFLLIIHVSFNLLDIPLVRINCFAMISQILLNLLDLCVFLLDPVHKPLSGLWEWQVLLICLQFKVTLSFGELGFFISEMLSPLLECVLFQTGFSLHQAFLNFFKLGTLFCQFSEEPCILGLQGFVIITLFGVKVCQPRFCCIADLLNLLLIGVYVVLDLPLLPEELV